jgi:hypothetical protein
VKSVIGVRVDDAIEWHAMNANGTDYHTLCGVDADDKRIGHYGTVAAPRGQKINCPQCHSLWRAVVELRLRESSFDV